VVAGNSTPAPCWLQNNEVVSSLIVSVGFIAPDGATYVVSYNHLDRIDVTQDERVVEGQQIGLSGVTGCVGRLNGRPSPHLHLQVSKVVGTPNRLVPIDPFGWEGPGWDPWSVHVDGAESKWLWKEGQSPNMAR